ncbi:hypothetical protein NP233_g13098 [Leucocoprinus birnbaumii]|uniref:Protein kinase domain-containing protein n=1 Tax=Leucocoprinus birnbaumii TaxID=56174 RepID=A0AAD5VD89_9AGAR|nr:hypothetical protein NP233_g13098 [Leucocoprinus birnbaumii]
MFVVDLQLIYAPFLVLFRVQTDLASPSPISTPYSGASTSCLSLDIISGLDYLHASSIVHGDLKAANVLVSRDGRAMLTDFGISHVVTTVATTVGQGTYRWMAPELFNDPPIKPMESSDIWSFGCTCLEIFTGSQPFPEYDPTMERQVTIFIIRGGRPSKPGYTGTHLVELNEQQKEEFHELIWDQCWKQAPTDRPSSNDIKLAIQSFKRKPKRAPIDSDLAELMKAVKKVRYKSKVNHDLVHKILLRLDREQVTSTTEESSSSSSGPGDSLELPHVVLGGNPVGEGGFGFIYKGLLGGRAVRILRVTQIFSSEERNLNILDTYHMRELLLWIYMRHPQILPLYSIFTLNTPRFAIGLVSPWIDNGNLAEYLSSFPEASPIPFISGIASGLEHLHDLGIVHSDLKAANVLVSGSLRPLLTDFGLSVRWSAPELFEDDFRRRPAFSSDIWSFGCVCLEILTHKIPYHHCRSEVLVIYAILKGQLPFQSREIRASIAQSAADQIWGIMLLTWDFDPDRRPTAAQIKALLTDFKLMDDNDGAFDPEG